MVLGYNSNHEAAAKAQKELADEFGVRSECVQVRPSNSSNLGSASHAQCRKRDYYLLVNLILTIDCPLA